VVTFNDNLYTAQWTTLTKQITKAKTARFPAGA